MATPTGPPKLAMESSDLGSPVLTEIGGRPRRLTERMLLRRCGVCSPAAILADGVELRCRGRGGVDLELIDVASGGEGGDGNP